MKVAVGPGGHIPREGRLDALEVILALIRRMVNVRHVVKIGTVEIHRCAISGPRDVAYRRTLDPTLDADVRRVVNVTGVAVERFYEGGSR